MARTRLDSANADSRPSDVDLSEKVHYLCKRTATGVDLCGDGEKAAGVIQEGNIAGYGTTFSRGPQIKVVAAEALNVGDVVQSDADGKAKAGNSNPFGTVITACSAEDELVEVEWDKV